MKCTKLRNNKNPALVQCSTPTSRSRFSCFSYPWGEAKARSKFRLYQHGHHSPLSLSPVRKSSKRPDFNKKKQMRGLWQQCCIPLLCTHRKQWRLLSVQTQRLPLMYPMAICSIPCLDQSFPSPTGGFHSVCYNCIIFQETIQQGRKWGYSNRRSLKGVKNRCWGRRSWEQSNPLHRSDLITCPWYTH